MHQEELQVKAPPVALPKSNRAIGAIVTWPPTDDNDTAFQQVPICLQFNFIQYYTLKVDELKKNILRFVFVKNDCYQYLFSKTWLK